jgi:restriction system protein
MIENPANFAVTPREYEIAVREMLDAASTGLIEYSSGHLETLAGVDGSYEFDVVARFTALTVTFVVLVECKHHARRVERSDVQVLADRIRSVGAHKGMLFSTSGFQTGAIEYAGHHGIALVKFAGGSSSYLTRDMSAEPVVPPPFANLPRFVGWWHHGSQISIMSSKDSKYTRQALFSAGEFKLCAQADSRGHGGAEPIGFGRLRLSTALGIA